MKRTISIILTIILAFSLFGCKTKQQEEPAFLPEPEKQASQSNQAESKTENTDVQNPSEQALDSSNEQTQTNDTSKAEATDNKPSSGTEDTAKAPVPEQKQQEELVEDTEDTQILEDESEDEWSDDSEASKTFYATQGVRPSGTFLESKYNSSDTFLCTVVEGKPINEPLTFPSFLGFDSGVMIYKVKVEKVYRRTFATEDTYINVIVYAKEPETEWQKQYGWVTPLEVGEKYIITALVQPYKKEPVMVNTAGLSAHVGSDGTLSPQSYVSSLVLQNIKTLEDFENDPKANEFFESKYEVIYMIADDYSTTRLDGVSPKNGYSITGSNGRVDVMSDEEVIEYIKNAIILDK